MIQSIATAQEEVDALSSPLVLPSGVKLPNRLVKAAMEEMLGTLGGGDPSESHCVLYEEWAKGNWGMIITGNVMVSPTHLGTPADIIVPFPGSPDYSQSLKAFKSWSKACKSHSSLAPVIVQLCHTGRQSMRGAGRSLLTPNLAPSVVPVNAGNSLLAKGFSRIVWGTPREMTELDFDEVVEGFVQGARVAKECGFDGVQLHGSHGYLLAQMLSPNVNLRTDSYGGSPRGRTKLMFRILDAIRAEFPLSSGFCVGIKLNSSDYVKGGLTEEDALHNVRWIAEHGGMDFIEISGGTYENAAMLGDTPPIIPLCTLKSKETTPAPSNREAFFLSFASSAQSLLQSLPSSSLPSPAPSILVTGGFRTRKGMASAILCNSTSLVGIGRPACVDPLLPLTILNPSLDSKKARAPIYNIKGIKWLKLLPIGIVGPGLSTIWHTMCLALISRKEEIDLEMNFLVGFWKIWGKLVVEKYWVWFSLVGVAVWSLGVRLVY